MTKKIDIIQLPSGAAEQIMAIVGCSRPTLFRSLRFENSSPKGKLIRELALNQFHGVVGKKTIFV